MALPLKAERALTRDDALGFNPRWTDADRALIQHHMNRLNVTEFYAGAHWYVGCVDASGNLVMYLGKGYLQWPEEYAPHNAMPHPRYQPWWPLTTMGKRSSLKAVK